MKQNYSKLQNDDDAEEVQERQRLLVTHSVRNSYWIHSKFVKILVGVLLGLLRIKAMVLLQLVLMPLLFSHRAPVVLISMDGFRHDYIELVKSKRGADSLPNFDRLLLHGVRVTSYENAYPTITAPNHHTIVTGLYPESHGVIANAIWDTDHPNSVFTLESQESMDTAPWLSQTKGTLPIWVELMKAGYRVGSMLWPFVDQPIDNLLPNKMQSEYVTLDMGDHGIGSMRYSKRVDRVIRWFSDPKEPLDFAMLYFEEPDAVGHAYGPNSEQLADTVIELDFALGMLLDGFEENRIRVDIILTADHGMTQLNAGKMIHLNTCLQPGTYNYTWLTTSGFVYAKEGMFDEVYAKLKKCHPKMDVYLLNQMPEVEHFNLPPSSRAPDFVLMANPGWVMVDLNVTTLPRVGNHGYSVTDSEMNPILIFSGPSFGYNQTIPSMKSVDLYPLMASMFRITPHPNNGTVPSGLGFGPVYI